MDSYEFLAGSYDALTGDVDYSGWADFLERQFTRCAVPVHTVLDLACGTGSLTRILASRGYEMIGVDRSEEMLALAAEKCRGAAGEAPVFLHQSMERLDLYGTVDACVCCLDSINYVTDVRRLKQAFQRVHLFLLPGGVFVFDVHAPEHLEALDGQIFLDENEDTYCVWRAEYARRSSLCTYGIDLFRRRTDGVWERGQEVHQERAYTVAELREYLRQAGFQTIRIYGDRKLRAPKAGEERLFFAAWKEQ